MKLALTIFGFMLMVFVFAFFEAKITAVQQRERFLAAEERIVQLATALKEIKAERAILRQSVEECLRDRK